MPALISPARGPSTVGRKPITSVGIGTSSVPYEAFGSFAAANTGVWGTVGPAAGSIRQPTTWYVRTTGSNNNGGTTSATSATRTGTDGATTNGSLTFTSASAAFTPADIGQGVCIQNATFCYAKIVSVESATSVTLSNPPSATAGSLSWSIGGAWANPLPFLNSTAFANATCGVQSGDTVYIGAGTYRQTHQIGTHYGKLWNATGGTVKNANYDFKGYASCVGDVDGSKTGDAGMVQFSAYTTNDKSAPSATALLTVSAKSNLAFSKIMFVGGTGSFVIDGSSTGNLTSQNVTFSDCTFISLPVAGSTVMRFTSTSGVSHNLLVTRCIFVGQHPSTSGVFEIVGVGGGVVYDTAWKLSNSVLVYGAGRGISCASSATGNNCGGGRVTNCLLVGGGTGFLISANNWSATNGAVVTGTVFVLSAGVTGLSAGTSGQIVESFNLIYAGTPRTNVSVGAGSISDNSYAPLLHFGQEAQWGGLLRMLGEPMASSPLLGFGNRDPIASNPLDLRGFPRPAGLGATNSQLPAVGAYERANTSIQATSPAPPSGTNVWKFTGPGYQDFSLPVDTSSTTVACTVQRDTNYAGTLPSISVLANPTIGVTAQTVFDTGGTASNNAIALAPFTTTAIGAVTIRVRSQDLSGTSVVAFSVFTVT